MKFGEWRSLLPMVKKQACAAIGRPGVGTASFISDWEWFNSERWTTCACLEPRACGTAGCGPVSWLHGRTSGGRRNEATTLARYADIETLKGKTWKQTYAET